MKMYDTHEIVFFCSKIRANERDSRATCTSTLEDCARSSVFAFFSAEFKASETLPAFYFLG